MAIASIQTLVPADRIGMAELAELLTKISAGDDQEAWDQMLVVYIPLIRKVARRHSNYQEGVSIALAAFVEAVRTYDPTKPANLFLGSAIRRMNFAVTESNRFGSTPVRVPQSTQQRYNVLLSKYDWDTWEALAHVQNSGLSRGTFLAITAASARLGQAWDHVLNLPVTTSELDTAIVPWLLTQVTAQQEQILRLALGFTDSTSENYRLEKGFKEGQCLTLRQVAQILGMTRTRAMREKHAALDTMRATLNSLMEYEAA